MNTEISTWGGYAVHGDVKELDRIVESTGLINLDKEDIIKVLSSDGEIFVTYKFYDFNSPFLFNTNRWLSRENTVISWYFFAG